MIDIFENEKLIEALKFLSAYDNKEDWAIKKHEEYKKKLKESIDKKKEI